MTGKTGVNPKKGRKTPKSTSKVASNERIRNLADQQIWQRDFNPDYDQIMLRISNAVTGLGSGGPPGAVS